VTRFISKNNVEISYDTRSKTLKLSKNGNGLYVDDMDDATRRELAFELLDDLYNVPIVGRPDQAMVLRPKPKLPKVGEYYQVSSTDGMNPHFQGNPIVRVTKVGRYSFDVETDKGVESTWPFDMQNLSGPVEVEQKIVTTWVAKG